MIPTEWMIGTVARGRDKKAKWWPPPPQARVLRLIVWVACFSGYYPLFHKPLIRSHPCSLNYRINWCVRHHSLCCNLSNWATKVQVLRKYKLRHWWVEHHVTCQCVVKIHPLGHIKKNSWWSSFLFQRSGSGGRWFFFPSFFMKLVWMW